MRSKLYMCVIGMGLALAITACGKDDAEKDMPAATQSSVKPAPAPLPIQQEPQFKTEPQKVEQAAPQQNSMPVIVPQTKPEFEIPSKYTCKNGTSFDAVFTRNPNSVRITFPGRVTVTLPQVDVRGAGFWYETGDYALRGRGPYAKWIMRGRDPVDCTAASYQASQGYEAAK